MLLARKIIARLIFGAIPGYTRKRKKMAQKWLSGDGIEIGALHNPLPTPSASNVTYVDIMNNEALLHRYPEMKGKDLVQVDLVDDGESLLSINDMSQDFVIANHILEHCVNPIGALQAWLRVLRFGGIAYIAVPDKRFTFDYQRATTNWRHLADDFNGAAEDSKNSHYIDWTKNVMNVPEVDIEGALANLLQQQPNIHFHTWTANSLNDFFKKCQFDLVFPFSICDFDRNGSELITVLKKTDASKN